MGHSLRGCLKIPHPANTSGIVEHES
jgi:hypothetical protein